MAISGSYSQIPGLRLLIHCKGGFPLGLLLRPKSAYPRKRCTKVSNLRDACCQDLPGQEVCSAHFCVDGFSDCFCICEAKLCGQRRVPHPRRAFGFCHGEEGEILSELLIPFFVSKTVGARIKLWALFVLFCSVRAHEFISIPAQLMRQGR